MKRFLRIFHKDADHANEQKKDKRFWIAVILLFTFIALSLVPGIASGTFREIDFGFRFHFSDGAALIVLAVAYLIYRIKRGRNDGE